MANLRLDTVVGVLLAVTHPLYDILCPMIGGVVLFWMWVDSHMFCNINMPLPLPRSTVNTSMHTTCFKSAKTSLSPAHKHIGKATLEVCLPCCWMDGVVCSSLFWSDDWIAFLWCPSRWSSVSCATNFMEEDYTWQATCHKLDNNPLYCHPAEL